MGTFRDWYEQWPGSAYVIHILAIQPSNASDITLRAIFDESKGLYYLLKGDTAIAPVMQ